MDLPKKLTRLASALRDHHEKILADWLGTLRIGMEKPGAPLTDSELRDHFGDLLEDLCNQLEVPLTEAGEISALKHAEIHGDMRWVQGYSLPELIREVAALRTVVIAAVVAEGLTRLSLQEQSLANIIVHRFFDALILESASFFAALTQDAAVLLERQKLAQELHDGACQTICGALFHLSLIRGDVKPSTAENIDMISGALKEGLDDIRMIVHGMVALVRKFENGLPAALEELGAGISRVLPCEVRCDPCLELPAKQGFHLLRIAQEAAGNACKHANAKKLVITLAEKDGAYELQIRDDGRGFVPADKFRPGIGLFNMEQRARVIGASFQLKTQPGTGTTIRCVLPKAGIVPQSESHSPRPGVAPTLSGSV